MNIMCRVSVVTPSFNMAEFLERTIESVLSNLKPGDEYFIIDGGSTDGSLQIIESYADRLTGWVSEKDSGYADALAKGFDQATGDVFCWINTGDLYLSGALDVAREILKKHEVDFIFGDDFYISEDDRIISFSRGWMRSLKSSMLYGGWTPLQDSCFWRRGLYEEVGGINSTLKYAADFDLFLRFSMAGEVMYVPYAFSAFRKHTGQKSIANSMGYNQERVSLLQNIRKCKNIGGLKSVALRIYYWVYLRVRARILYRFWDNKKSHGQVIGSMSVTKTDEL